MSNKRFYFPLKSTPCTLQLVVHQQMYLSFLQQNNSFWNKRKQNIACKSWKAFIVVIGKIMGNRALFVKVIFLSEFTFSFVIRFLFLTNSLVYMKMTNYETLQSGKLFRAPHHWSFRLSFYLLTSKPSIWGFAGYYDKVKEHSNSLKN